MSAENYVYKKEVGRSLFNYGISRRNVTFETAIIERYHRRETFGEEALMEMYFAGVLVRKVEDIIEVLRGTIVSPGTISNLKKSIRDNLKMAEPSAQRQLSLRLC